ncbi:MAG: redoxin family protein [Phycisphaerales bacterium]|nr:redoxin family protein [Phycisphaerales bacterium]
MNLRSMKSGGLTGLILIQGMILAATACMAPALAAPKDGEVETLAKAYSAAQEKWFKKHKSPSKRDYTTHPIVEYMPKFKALAESKPKSAVAMDAMIWALENCKFLRYTNIEKKEEYYAWAFKGLKTDFAADPAIEPKLKEFIDLPFHYGPAPLGEIYEAVIKDNPGKEAKAWAMVALGVSLTEYYGELGPRSSQTRTENRKRAQELFKKVASDYPQSEAVEEAKRRLHGLTALSVGSAAPEIVGKDADGKEIKLSDFRGKVVVLDFWTKDCDSCDEFHEAARELLTQYKDKPFAWLGINGDPAPPEELKKAMGRANITWPNILDGASRSISKAWNVDGYPTVLVIDREGVIRRQQADRQSVKLQVKSLMDMGAAPAGPKPEEKGKEPAPAKEAGSAPTGGATSPAPPKPQDPPSTPPPPPGGEKPKDKPGL